MIDSTKIKILKFIN